MYSSACCTSSDDEIYITDPLEHRKYNFSFMLSFVAFSFFHIKHFVLIILKSGWKMNHICKVFMEYLYTNARNYIKLHSYLYINDKYMLYSRYKKF